MSNIKISGLVKTYASNKVLDNISLEFECGKDLWAFREKWSW